MSSFQVQLMPYDLQNTLPIEIHCSGNRLNKHSIELSYVIAGNIENIRFDTPADHPKRTDELWKKTCFEAFIKPDDTSSYWEYNLSPSGNWAIYGFRDYREEQFDELSLSIPAIQFDRQGEQITLRSQIPLPEPLIKKNLNFGLSAVVQDINGDIYYYALQHTKSQPDFHAHDSFSIAMSAWPQP